MEKMLVKGNLKFPTIDFNPDSGVFEIFGRSLPENTIDFYSPVLEWIDEYKSSPAKNRSEEHTSELQSH